MFPKPAHDARHVLSGSFSNDLQVFFADIGFSVSQYIFNDFVVNNASEFPQHFFPDSQKTLMCTVFLSKAFLCVGLSVGNGHNVHRTVSDVAQHRCPSKFRQSVSNCGKALRKHIHADDMNKIKGIIVLDYRVFLLQQIITEAFLLF